MKIKELIKELKTYDQEMTIQLANYVEPYSMGRSEHDYPLEQVSQINDKEIRLSSYPCVR